MAAAQTELERRGIGEKAGWGLAKATEDEEEENELGREEESEREGTNKRDKRELGSPLALSVERGYGW